MSLAGNQALCHQPARQEQLTAKRENWDEIPFDSDRCFLDVIKDDRISNYYIILNPSIIYIRSNLKYMKIIFTDHAKFKFKLFERHGLMISESQIKEIIENPASTVEGKKGRLVIQSKLDENHIMRVICEMEHEEIRVITFYPAKRGRYENQL